MSRTLVLYCYYENEDNLQNLRYFLDHGYVASDDVQYYFLINNGVCTVRFPKTDNVHVIERTENTYDLLTYKWFFKTHNVVGYTSCYLINASCRGPFLPPYVGSKTWIQLLNDVLATSDLVGPIIEIPPDTFGWTAVDCTQSTNIPFIHTYMFGVSAKGLLALVQMFDEDETETKQDVVVVLERKITSYMLLRNLKIKSLQKRYESVNLNDSAVWDYKLWSPSGLTCPEIPGNYDSIDVHPFEIMFVKNLRNVNETRGLEQAGISSVLASNIAKYTAWSSPQTSKWTYTKMRSYTYGTKVHSVDVTDIVEKLVAMGHSRIRVTNDLFTDVHFGVQKALTIYNKGVEIGIVTEGDDFDAQVNRPYPGFGKESPRVAIITAVYNSTPSFPTFVAQSIPVDFICFSNNVVEDVSGWTVDATPYHGDAPYPEKYYKQSFHKIPRLADYDVIVWVDKTIDITNPDVAQIMADIALDKGTPVCFDDAMCRNMPDTLLVQSRIACGRLARTSTDPTKTIAAVQSQVKAYVADGYKQAFFPDSSAWATSIIGFNMQQQKTNVLLDTWYQQTLTYTTEDAMAFSYACWKTSTTPYTLASDKAHISTYMYTVTSRS